MTLALEIVFWVSCALIVWTQVGYALALAGIARMLPRAASGPRERTRRSDLDPRPAHPAGASETTLSQPSLPALSLIIAAHDEQTVITAKVHNALALDYPRELLEVIVACDGCSDETAARAREAGADLVLELPRGGKIRAQDAAVQKSRGEIVAFSDANAQWEPDAAQILVGAFEDPRVGYACGQVRFVRGTGAAGSGTVDEGDQMDASAQNDAGARADAGAPNQEGVYWRYEMVVRALESRLSSITAGNGAIYATRRASYIVVDPIMGHDLSLPFNMVKRGLRAVYVPDARAEEKMGPSLAGEFARKRRMMSHTWPIVLRGGMLSPRGYPPGYALMILSHRLLRYSTAALHAVALAANLALVALGGGGEGCARVLYLVTLDLHIALLLAAALAGVLSIRPLLIARYYVLTTAWLAAGWWDCL